LSRDGSGIAGDIHRIQRRRHRQKFLEAPVAFPVLRMQPSAVDRHPFPEERGYMLVLSYHPSLPVEREGSYVHVIEQVERGVDPAERQFLGDRDHPAQMRHDGFHRRAFGMCERALSAASQERHDPLPSGGAEREASPPGNIVTGIEFVIGRQALSLILAGDIFL
jgi:hypothetical protein